MARERFAATGLDVRSGWGERGLQLQWTLMEHCSRSMYVTLITVLYTGEPRSFFLYA